MSLPYQEGTLFAVPLPGGGFGVGVVARATSEGKVILCYFFGPRRRQVPTLRDIGDVRPRDAVRVLRVGDLGLISGEWSVIGQSSNWRRSEWPIPAFLRADPLSGRAWLVEYDDSDPNHVIREIPIDGIDPSLDRDSLSGSGAAERKLDALLA